MFACKIVYVNAWSDARDVPAKLWARSTPGARTFWHTHERGQILTVTMGYGLICSKGQEPKRLQVGDVVHVPGGETHWHGGTSDTCMAHTAISLGSELLVIE